MQKIHRAYIIKLKSVRSIFSHIISTCAHHYSFGGAHSSHSQRLFARWSGESKRKHGLCMPYLYYMLLQLLPREPGCDYELICVCEHLHCSGFCNATPQAPQIVHFIYYAGSLTQHTTRLVISKRLKNTCPYSFVLNH